MPVNQNAIVDIDQLFVDENGNTGADFGSGIVLGNGFILTAGHVIGNGLASNVADVIYDFSLFNLRWNGSSSDIIRGWSDPGSLAGLNSLAAPTTSNANIYNVGNYSGQVQGLNNHDVVSVSYTHLTLPTKA